uniref:Peptidase C2 calpain domain-containing protein n=2 Tax=Octopus bimaculoides TaxID=37653 RepID=A0A0L8HWK8_OCTBM|eukprot:XP_014768788.1 PREDICTED: uncharacterized protein LOC106868161 [Octopus bimaculoides]
MWDTVNGDFMERYKPLQNKEQDEYWMTVEDFRCNFGSMIICSSSEPYVPEGLNLTRKYSRTEKHFVLQSQQLTQLKSNAFKIRSWSLTEQYSPSECGDDVLKRERDLLDTPHIFKDRQEESPDSGGSFRSVFSPSNNKVFQFELGSSPRSPDFIESQPHHHRSLTSSPISGIQRKLAYQPPGRSPLVSEKSGEEPKPDPGRERRQSRPLIRGKSANLPRDTLSESVSNLGDSSWVSSYKDLLAPFGIKRKNNNEVTDSSSDFVKTGDFQKTQKAKSFDGCSLPMSRDSSSQGESNQTTSVRSKSVSLYQSYYREQEKLKEKSQITVKSATKAHSGVGVSSSESREAEKGLSVPRKTSCGQNETEQTRRPSIQFFRQATIEGDTEEPIASAKGEPEKPTSKKQSEEKRGKTLFKSCLSTDEDDDDDDVDDVRDDTCKNLSHDAQMTGIQEREIRKEGEESSKPELTVDNSSQVRKISSESEKGVRVTTSPTKTNLQSSQSNDGNSDFIALVNKVKKVRLRSAPDRTHSESSSGGFTQPHQQQASMTPPTRKYGRHERLNLFCHSNRESSQSVSDLTSRIDAGAATTTTATLLPITDEHRNISLGTVSSLSESNFLASKVDHFCPTGRWSQLVNYHGNWTKRNNSFDMDQNPRILLTVHKLDAWKSDLDTVFSGRSHVIISLLQDYRHGSSTANNLIQPIGFCIYKTKYPEKDERKHLSKLTFVSKEMSNGGSREVIKRTNLEQGNYFIVPFCSNKEHTGEFIVRVLAEKNVKEEKSDCKLS